MAWVGKALTVVQTTRDTSINMNESKLATIEQIEEFLSASADIDFKANAVPTPMLTIRLRIQARG
jgi:hypothetical protein